MSEISGISEEVPQGTEATTETTADIAKKLQDRVAAIYPWQQLFKDRKVVQTSGGEAVAKITAKLESHGLLRRIAFGSKANLV